jgi:phage shock protein E
MNLFTWIIIAAIVAFLLLSRFNRVPPAAVHEWLNNGALVIDVRSPEEFQERHLMGVVNIPLNRLSGEIARHAPDKTQPLLLHCRSGSRSGRGADVLKKMGYQHVVNLGSYSQAERIIAAK